ncbi:MAG: hypothetical protein H3Z51_00055 [archaeon]|nr:hypothetical protein [archaeon]
MSEEILGRIEAGYPALDIHHADDVLNLVFTSNRIIVARMISGISLLMGYGTGKITKRDVEKKKKEMREFYEKLPPEGVLKVDEKNYAIP